MRLSALLTVFAILLVSPLLSAEEIEPGVKYAGPKTLGIERIGVSFQLPAGWEGTLPQGEETFVIGRTGTSGYIFLVAEQATVAEATSAMSEAIPMDTLVMMPKGQASAKGSTVTNEYTVSGGQAELVGKATAKLGSTGWGVMVLTVATPEDMPELEKAASAIVASVKIVKPKKPKVSTTGYWGKMFAGKRIVRFYSGSGYHEQRQIAMCPDGRFIFSFDSGGFSMSGASGAFETKNAGTWSVAGGATGGTLTLRYNDGRESVYQLAETDGKLMVDGQRWLRDPINCN